MTEAAPEMESVPPTGRKPWKRIWPVEALIVCMVMRPVFGVYKKRGKTVGGEDADVTVMVATAEMVPSVRDLAVSVTLAGEGTVAGAAYSMVVLEAGVAGERVPHAGLHAVPV